MTGMARKASKPRASARRGSRASIGMGARRARVTRTSQVRTHRATGGLAQFSAGHRGHGGGYRGFKSRKQWRWAYATHKAWARKKAHETAGGPIVRYRRLPESKHSGHKGRRTP